MRAATRDPRRPAAPSLVSVSWAPPTSHGVFSASRWGLLGLSQGHCGHRKSAEPAKATSPLPFFPLGCKLSVRNLIGFAIKRCREQVMQLILHKHVQELSVPAFGASIISPLVLHISIRAAHSAWQGEPLILPSFLGCLGQATGSRQGF